MNTTNAIHSTSREIAGRTVTVNWFPDYDSPAPWDHEDGHGPVSDWTRRDKQPGEMVLCEDRGTRRFYDFSEAVAIARRDGWDCEPYGQGTPGERAHRAAMADFQHLRGWCLDEWQYVGYVVEIDGEEFPEIEGSLWGIDSPSMDYFEKEAFATVAEFLTREDAACFDAACRDVATL
jgi:hypothetical protein